MKDLKIKFKLYTVISILLVSLIFTGLMSLELMKELNNGTTVVSANWLPSVIIAEELNTSTSDFRIAEISHVVSQDSATMLKHEQTILEVTAEINDMFNTYYNDLITNETDKALIEEAGSLWDKYHALHLEMITYSKNNDTTSAMNIMENESEALFDEVSNIFLKLVAFNKEGADQASLDGDSLYVTTLVIISIIIIAVTLICIMISKYIIDMITKPIFEIEEAAEQMSKGILSINANYHSEDELGTLSNSMRSLSSMFQKMIADLSHVLDNMAKGDFTTKSKSPELYIGDFEPLIKLTNAISEQISDTLSHINESANQVSTGSSQVSNTAQTLAQGALEQSASIEQLSDTLSNIEEQTKLNADNANLAKNESEKSRSDIIQSSEKMENMIHSMHDISIKSNEISKIIKVIDDIAFQTNILALNAAVEAARAGEAGKGFAVVADEVRNLAIKSAESAQNTAKLIEETIDAVNTGVDLANETGQAIDEVVGVVQNTTDLIEKISLASDEQKLSVLQITTEVHSISSVVRSNTASTEETAATSEELNVQSTLLKSLVSNFTYIHK